MENFDQLRELVRTPRQCVILSHRNPDGDALGSCLGLSLFLQSLNHNVRVIFPSEFPVNFEWMPQTEEILVCDLEPGLVAEVIRKAELVFFLDFNSLDRIDKIAPLLEANQAPRVMIDHHIDPFPIADLMFSEAAASSTSEMIFNIIEKIQPGKLPGMLVLECLYTGIMTDTGSFRHATSERVFSILARFKSAGLNDTRIQELVNNSYPDKYLKLLGHCLHNRLELIPEQQFGLIWLTREDYRSFDIQRGDTEGIINYLMMLKTVKVGALVMNQPAIVKLSLRSKGDYSVQQICSRYFGGGGHRNASGGFCKCTLEESISRLKEAIAANPVPAVTTLT